MRPLAAPIRRVLVILAPTQAEVKSVRRLGRILRPLGIELWAASECHGEVRDQRREPLYPNLLLIQAALREWDAIIVGAGVIGLALARRLRHEGLRVLLIDKGEPGKEASYAAGSMIAHCDPHLPTSLKPLAVASPPCPFAPACAAHTLEE